MKDSYVHYMMSHADVKHNNAIDITNVEDASINNQTSKMHNIDVVVWFAGELENHLHIIAASYAVKYVA